MKMAFSISLLVLALIAARDGRTQQEENKFKIPESIKREHAELHAKLDRAIKTGGKTGMAAREVAKLMHGHFLREEEFAMPPLGLLKELSEGNATPEMEEVLPLTDKLQKELPQMLEEHQSIMAALDRLAARAKEENKPEVVEFTEKLMQHAKTEEEVMYPAAILVGKYLELKFKK